MLIGIRYEILEPVVYCRATSANEVISDDVTVDRMQLVRLRIP